MAFAVAFSWTLILGADEPRPKFASRWLGPIIAKKTKTDLLGPNIDHDGFAALETLVGAPLSDEAIARIESVTTRQPIYRHLPTQSIRCHPALLAFCVRHPDLVIALWERLGVTELAMKEIATGDPENEEGIETARRAAPTLARFTLTESTGTCATVDHLYIDESPRESVCLVGVRGTYRGPFSAKEIDGESLLLFRWRVEEDGDEKGSVEKDAAAPQPFPLVVCRLDTFVSIHDAAAESLAKMLVPILGKIADSNFEQTIAFVSGLSEVISTDGETIKQVVYRLPTLRREVRRDLGLLLDHELK